MIKWLSGSRLKTATENESSSALTNDPLAAITGIGAPDGHCHIYAVSRVNPLFKDEREPGREETEASLNDSSDQRLSPRKSISSGYESRCNSSSDSSSCTECEEKQFNKSLNGLKREKRLTKQSKSEKKKRADYEKWDGGPNQILQTINQDSLPSPTNFKRRPRKYKNGSPPGSSNLSPIPEGKIDCSIPPPIWPRCEDNCTEIKERNFNTQVPGRIFHNGTTNPLNFMFKYNEKYPKCCNGTSRSYWNYFDEHGRISGAISVKTEYEHNWIECCKNQKKEKSYLHDGEDSGKSGNDSGKGLTPESTLERFSNPRHHATQEVLKDLANLIAYAMSKPNSVPLDSILKNLADSIQKCLEVLSQTDNEESLRVLCDNINRNKFLNKMWTAMLNRDAECCAPRITGDENKNGVDTAELALELQKLSEQKRDKSKINEDLDLYRIENLKDEIYSSGSEGKNSSSSSSGCKDLYISSNSSSAGKDNVFSASSFESVHERDKPYHKAELYKSGSSVRGRSDSRKSSDENDRKGGSSNGKCQSDSVLSLIHHQRDLSSSSVESTFGFSDTSPTPSDSSSAKGVLNPVFLHENIYSVPKSMRNAIICDSLSRTKDAGGGSISNCGSSAFEKLISAKRKTSSDSRADELGPLAYIEDGKTQFPAVMTSAKVDNTVLKKIEHPYYVAMGRPDFTLDLPQAEKLMKKIASSKRRRCWCRLMTSLLGLAFFLLSVMMVSLVVTKGQRMFGAL